MSDYLRSYIIPPTSPPITPSQSFISQNPDENIQILNSRAAELYDFLIGKTLAIHKQISIFSMGIRKFKNNSIEYWHSFRCKFTENKTVLAEFFKRVYENTLKVLIKTFQQAKKSAFRRLGKF